MRFEFYHEGLLDIPKLSVDGTVPNSVQLSHWQGNETPADLKADTSTEIALNFVAARDSAAELTRGIEIVTNNHFDTDGVLSVWVALTGERALDLRDELIAAAEAGDFSAYTTERAIRASLAIQGADQPVTPDDAGSPLARHLAGATVADDARAYELVLPEVERVLRRPDDYEPLWRDAWDFIARSLESFARGASRVEEETDTGCSLITLAPDLYGPAGFAPTRHAAPFTAISHHARGEVFLIATPLPSGGWAYRLDYPYYSWADTITRPRILRRDFAPFINRLNQLDDNSQGAWKLDASELSSAAKFTSADGHLAASSLPPEQIAEELRATLKQEVSSFEFRVSSSVSQT